MSKLLPILMILAFVNGCASVPKTVDEQWFYTQHKVKQGYYNEFLLPSLEESDLLRQQVVIKEFNRGKWLPAFAHRAYSDDLANIAEFRVSFDNDERVVASFRYFTKGDDGKYVIQLEEKKLINGKGNSFSIRLSEKQSSLQYYLNDELILDGPKLHDNKFIGTLYVSMAAEFYTYQE